MEGKDPSNPFAEAKTIARYLVAENVTVRNAITTIISTVQAAANQSVQTIRGNHERISDLTDHLDGVFTTALSMSQAEEMAEIGVLANELDAYYNQIVIRQGFSELFRNLDERATRLEAWEKRLQQKESQLEKIIHKRVAHAEARAKEESTSSKGLFESALRKSEKVFDQNKITRFVCSTISRFQDEFESIRSGRDVEHVTRLFQQTIEQFQTTRMVPDQDGKPTMVITNAFSEDCYQDLFLFFYKYYNELLDIYEAEQALPSTADELARIFRKKRKGAEQIIAQMHKRPQSRDHG